MSDEHLLPLFSHLKPDAGSANADAQEQQRRRRQGRVYGRSVCSPGGQQDSAPPLSFPVTQEGEASIARFSQNKKRCKKTAPEIYMESHNF